MRIRLQSIAWVTLLTWLALPQLAQAHRQWLVPSSTQLNGQDQWVIVDAAVSENLFDFDSRALDLDGLTITSPRGQKVAPQNQFSGQLRSTFDFKLDQQGTYKVSVVDHAEMVSYKLNGEMHRWRGNASEAGFKIPAQATDVERMAIENRLETFVSLGEPTVVPQQLEGDGLELQPITATTSLYAKDTSRFRLFLDGKPAANMKVSVVPGGVRYRGVLNEMLVSTNAGGEFEVTWPQAGMYWLHASYPPREPGKRPVRMVSYSATFEVLPY
ncbi:MAG TPA: DUF4198 domain-containing protein [Limnobacter sp.]|uniref:DUF4198 domain-containing protein n=1 Tax=Limnobacter sp. TaxID=2003368 RepID=UPI002E2F9526|nr:DUF4198 domain-containing protein [Limnobacter sp.]HEX5484803.1 DUF4198 domain-containing protein [Limnobacter sp.]